VRAVVKKRESFTEVATNAVLPKRLRAPGGRYLQQKGATGRCKGHYRGG
jgi:hypothetical protein